MRSRRQRGTVLFVALIAIIMMTVAGIALMRSVDGGNQMAGNLGFRQSAVHSGDAGVERARRWLINNAGATLNADDTANGYYAQRADPADWETFFATLAPPTTFVDGVGNTVTYVVHRLCANAGDPNAPATGCVTNASFANAPGNSRATGRRSIAGDVQFYYRVTTQVVAPRRTVVYVQSVLGV